jgi:hypothetical protein
MGDRHKMRRVPIDQVTTPKDGLFMIHCDSWWAVSHDDEVYFFGTDRFPFASPQCNRNEELSRRINEDRAVILDPKMKHCELTNYKETRQLPVVFRPIDIAEYV